jgi:hypothetical protein
MKIKAFVKGDFIGHEGKLGAEVEVLKLVPQARYITFEPHLVDNCFENTSRIKSGLPPINQINFAGFDDLKYLEIHSGAGIIQIF